MPFTSELADEHEVNRVVRQHGLVELVRIKTIRDDTRRALRLPDKFGITVGGEKAFEQQAVAQGQHQPALGHDVEPTHDAR